MSTSRGEYAEDVAKLARESGAEKVVIVAMPNGFPAGWDLSDAPPEGWDLAGLRKLLNAAAYGENLTLPDFETVLDLAQNQQTAIGGQTAAVEAGDDLFAGNR